MSDDKRKEFGPKPKGPEDPARTDSSSRARNRTVLLTPEVAGQVRALLNKDEDKSADPLSDVIPNASWDVPQGGNLDRPTTTWTSESLSSPEAERPPFSVKRPSPAPQRSSMGGSSMGGPTERPAAPATPAGNAGFSGIGFTSAGRQPSAPPVQSAPPPHAQVHAASSPHVHSAHITPQVVPPPPPRERQRKGTGTFQMSAETKLIGFLVSYDGESNGEIVELRVGRWLLTSRPSEHGDHILIDDDSISPLHAIVRAAKDGKVQVLDQLSEFGTGIIRSGADKEEEVTGAMVQLGNADVIRFGKRYFIVCLIPSVTMPKKEDEAKEPASE